MTATTCPTAPVPVPLIELTDEELAALSGPPDGVVVSPYLDGLEAAQRDQALLTAFRSLVARGLVEAPTRESACAAVPVADAELVEVEVRMSEALAQTLTLRRVAPVVLCAQRTDSARTSWRYVHVVDDELALDEVVEAGGLHRFGLLRPADVPEALLDWVVPDGWDGIDGPATDVAAGADVPLQLLDRLGTALLVADLVVRRAGDGGGDVLLGTFAGPDLLVLSTTRSAPGSAAHLRPASRRTVRDAIAEQLGRR
jgi:hypothetical protein